jgi:hypothetical protein
MISDLQRLNITVIDLASVAGRACARLMYLRRFGHLVRNEGGLLLGLNSRR